MTDILLVVGSVTAKQYTSARFKPLRQGIKPKVVRIDPVEFSDRMHDYQLESGASNLENGEVVFTMMTGHTTADIVVVVFEREVWLSSEADDYSHIVNFVNNNPEHSDRFDCYISHPDGQLEIT